MNRPQWIESGMNMLDAHDAPEPSDAPEPPETQGDSAFPNTARAGRRLKGSHDAESAALHRHPRWSLSNLVSVSSALMFGQGVSSERRQRRLEICSTCDKLVNDGKTFRCGVCGCKLRGKSSALVDLLKYEETPRYGCKHPKGSRWKEQGV